MVKGLYIGVTMELLHCQYNTSMVLQIQSCQLWRKQIRELIRKLYLLVRITPTVFSRYTQ